MAQEFPIDPAFDRFVDPMSEAPQGEEDEEGVEVELDINDDDIEELPDGSVIVKMDTKGPRENEDFYQNLSEGEDFDFDVSTMAMRYIKLIDNDKEARKKRDEQYEEGIKRTGLGNDAPGGAQFQGASKVVHPVMAEACVDFASRAIKEMFPPDGPTRTKILGEVDKEKIEIAETSRRLGISLEQARDRVLMGEAYAGKKKGGLAHI